ncbi:uncharacterized protein LOC135219979 isoform X1 [Macrobrachium nipponense]|uniref:uncharacterized protein LOC135219979 isoform X1 n=1 Tax=Macrobrachium nipponense TaxID=159736 RepID=UPI0030C8B2DF
MTPSLITLTCLAVLLQKGVLGDVSSGSERLSAVRATDELAAALREISEAITSTARTCSRAEAPRGKSVFGVETELITQTLRQNSDAVSSLLAQTETLKLAMTSVAEVQSAQQQMVAALRSELESEKMAKRNLRRSVHDLRSELHTVKEESKAWREHLARLESEIKAGLQKSELAAQEATIEVKSTGERVNSLGEVIRQVQGSLQGLEKTVTRHTSNIIALRKTKGKGVRPSEKTDRSEETAVDSSLERPDENLHCPHPYTRIGLGCFTIHSTQRYTWERARQHCEEFNGDLANPYDLYDIVLFLDETFPDFPLSQNLCIRPQEVGVSGSEPLSRMTRSGTGYLGSPSTSRSTSGVEENREIRWRTTRGASSCTVGGGSAPVPIPATPRSISYASRNLLHLIDVPWKYRF